MKKIFYLIMLLPLSVLAANYGLEYKNIDTLDLKVTETKKYRFFKEKEIAAYFLEEEAPIEFVKQEDFYYSPYSEWEIDTPSERLNREVEMRDMYEYMIYRKVRRFFLQVDDPEAVISEFNILVDGGATSYQLTCFECSNKAYLLLNDGDYEQALKVGQVYQNLEQAVGPRHITIRVKFNKENVPYRITIYENDATYGKLFGREFISDLEVHDYTIDDFDYFDAFEGEFKTSEYNFENYLMNTYQEYRYRDKFYKYLWTYREYYPTYEENVEGYIKDEDDFIVFKDYSYLESATVKDKIVLTSENYDLNDYIKTNLPYKVEDNINIQKNGTYKVKYIFPNKVIERDVKVETDNEYKEELKQKLEAKNQEITDIVKTKNEMIEHLEATLKNKDEIISKKTVERTIEKPAYFRVILITIGVMLLIFCIYKSFEKNVELKK